MFACLHAPGNLPLLLECARYFSPLIEETSPDTVIFDIRGLRLIFGTPEQIAAEIHRRVGLPANIALASNPDAAMHAALGIQGVTVIPPGQEAAMLRSLPLCFLGGSSELGASLGATLDAWGIRTCGELAALPPLGVAARLGDEGLRMQRLARGEGHRLLRLRGEPVEFQEEMELESPVELLEPLCFLLARMLNGLCDRLRAHSLAVNEIRLLLKLENSPDHKTDHITTLRLSVPMLDANVFLKLLQLELSGRPPQAAVERIHLRLTSVQPRTLQHGLFLPASPEPEKLAVTLARIRNLVGASNIGAPEPLDTYRPDSFRLGPLLLAQHKNARPRNASTARPQLALRRFRPVRPVEVSCAADGRPANISSQWSAQGKWRVMACAGPWLTSGDWWIGEPWDCEEWDVEVPDNRLFRIHQNRRIRRWFVEGSYD
jgi:protein ImuB